MLDWIYQNLSAIATITAALIAAVASFFAAYLARRMQRQLTTVRDVLERERSIAVFKRKRISAHLDVVLRETIELASIVDMAGRQAWMNRADTFETERAVYSGIQSVRFNFRILLALQLIEEQLNSKAIAATDSIWLNWRKYMGQVTSRNDDFHKAHPEYQELSPKEFQELWMALKKDVTNLQDSVVELLALATNRLPK